mmetsp:Transcript_7090/g.12338  ORF Transcript_7090/g.12338 Transcript_7090/m.12338 type:complete len:80 (-) Transcript_7090:158-397(-)
MTVAAKFPKSHARKEGQPGSSDCPYSRPHSAVILFSKPPKDLGRSCRMAAVVGRDAVDTAMFARSVGGFVQPANDFTHG